MESGSGTRHARPAPAPNGTRAAATAVRAPSRTAAAVGEFA